MFSKFKYEPIELKDIALDDRNPRIVTQKKLGSQNEILKYLFDHDDLSDFVNKIAAEGKNFGAERPYIVKSASGYVVVEGNTRIAAYKLLTGLLSAPQEYAGSLPSVSAATKKALLSVDCSIAPNRDALLPIMANAHFGLGDKSKWGYLGSRKAVFDERQSGKSLPQLAKAFDRTKGQITELILEYQLYLKALSLKWTNDERDILIDPAVEFNPPVRFLQTRGHKEKTGISYDKANFQVVFADKDAEKKFHYLVKKLVVNPTTGLGATASYDEVFQDFLTKSASAGSTKTGSSTSKGGADGGAAGGGSSGKAPNGKLKDGSDPSSSGGEPASAKPKPNTLFGYTVTMNSNLVRQLMKEAKGLSCKNFPGASTFLLRNIVEAILKEIIHQQKANPASTQLDLERSLNICASNAVTLSTEDKKVLKEFNKTHLNYLNLGSHGTIIPSPERVEAARDCIDQFVKRNV